MGHATRFLAAALFAAGAVLCARYLADLVRPTSLTAPFEAADSIGEVSRQTRQPPVATFSPGFHFRSEAALRIEYLGIEPYSAGAARDTLSIVLGAHEERHDLTPGAVVAIGGESYRVAQVRAWQGLMSITDGATMVSISVLPDDAAPIENFLLRAGQRLDIDGVISLDLRECDSREEAFDRIAEEPGDTLSGRWGIVDTTGVIWFEGFTPGVGATLMDGSIVVLESVDASGPTLIVRKRTRDSNETFRVDGPSNRPPVLLEYIDADFARLVIYVFEDAHAVVTTGTRGVEPVELTNGDSWDVPGVQIRLRLEQAMRSAAPVEQSASPFFEAVLVTADRRVRVRQGEAVRVGDALVRYVRAPNDETTAFRLRVMPPAGEPVEVLLVPGGAHDFAWCGNDWSIGHDDVSPGEGVTIRRAIRSSVLLIAGVAFVAAAFCLLSIGPRREEN